jgi:hypothetical protein
MVTLDWRMRNSAAHLCQNDLTKDASTRRLANAKVSGSIAGSMNRNPIVCWPPQRLPREPLSGAEDKPENYYVVTYKLTHSGNQTILMLR